jgi:hypothetical protein
MQRTEVRPIVNLRDLAFRDHACRRLRKSTASTATNLASVRCQFQGAV